MTPMVYYAKLATLIGRTELLLTAQFINSQELFLKGKLERQCPR